MGITFTRRAQTGYHYVSIHEYVGTNLLSCTSIYIILIIPVCVSYIDYPLPYTCLYVYHLSLFLYIMYHAFKHIMYHAFNMHLCYNPYTLPILVFSYIMILYATVNAYTFSIYSLSFMCLSMHTCFSTITHSRTVLFNHASSSYT